MRNIDVLSEKERFLKAADEINWHPEHMKNRYKIWVENLKWDWCISRQRYFGVPFPVWYCKQCKKPIFAEEERLPVNPLESKKATEMLEKYEIGQARHEVDNLFWKDFCDYYIEIAKERLYQPEKHGKDRQYSGQIAIYYSLLGILKLYAIYTPYVTDYIYKEFYEQYEKEISIHKTTWNTREVNYSYIEFGEHIKDIIAKVRKNKTENQLSMKDKIPELIIECPDKFMKMYRATIKDIMACTGAESIKFK